jgi:L,D-peptidoglycan transpeptidase YkuD (ErfK/YbiS/YcfS/YnhG family)
MLSLGACGGLGTAPVGRPDAPAGSSIGAPAGAVAAARAEAPAAPGSPVLGEQVDVRAAQLAPSTGRPSTGPRSAGLRSAGLSATGLSATGLSATGLPAGVPAPPEGTNQLVTVLVPGAGSGSGVLQAWRRSGATWTSALGPVRVKVGTQGVGPTHEGLNRTPRGSFELPSTFGRQPNPGTKMPYRQVGNSDWWVSDQRSPKYNTYQHCAPGSCSFNEKAGENLGAAGASYDYAVVIGYNVAPVRPGAGSAFFVHVDAGAASAGCVETPRASVISLLRWLDPAQHPRITIGFS